MSWKDNNGNDNDGLPSLPDPEKLVSMIQETVIQSQKGLESFMDPSSPARLGDIEAVDGEILNIPVLATAKILLEHGHAPMIRVYIGHDAIQGFFRRTFSRIFGKFAGVRKDFSNAPLIPYRIETKCTGCNHAESVSRAVPNGSVHFPFPAIIEYVRIIAGGFESTCTAKSQKADANESATIAGIRRSSDTTCGS